MYEYYIIKTKIKNNNNIYYYLILEEKKKDIIIKIGGLNEQCIRIILNKKKNIGYVQDLIYKKNCSIFQKLNKNKNKIELLLKSALFFCIKKFPEIYIYEINDMSYLQCSNTQKISLADLYTVKYGKTWYEKVFNAIPIEEHAIDIQQYKQLIEKKSNIILDYEIEEFIDKYYTDTKNLNINKNMNYIKNAYTKGMKVKDYLSYFFNNNLDCRLYILFFKYYFSHILYGTYWKITKETIADYNIDINIYETEIINKHIDLENLYTQLENANNEI